MTLQDLAALLRGLQLYAHNAHNLAKGATFLEDHEFLGELYGAYEGEYDTVVELILGDEGKIDLIATQEDAVAVMKTLKGEAFQDLLTGENHIQSVVNDIAKTTKDQGILQTIGTIAESSKVRKYKIGRKLKK